MASTVTSTLPLARFSVEQYHRMIASGAFTEDDELELIDGWVVHKMAKGPGHEYSTGRLADFLRQHVPPRFHVRDQAPVTLARSEPEPDLSVARGGRADYRGGHPHAEDLALVVEVSDTSLAIDRLKGASYGRAGVPEYWILNLPERRLEVHTQPSAEEECGYRSRAVLSAEHELELVIEGQPLGRIRVSELLP